MRIFIFCITAMISFGFFFPSDSRAATMSDSIAAVVNEDAITESDVDARMRLMIISSGLPSNKEIREKLKPQVINSLVEERIKLQEAERMEIAITEDEIQEGLGVIAQQNNLTADQFKQVMRRDGVKVRTLRQQIEAQIAWGRVVQERIRPQIQITAPQIDAMRDRITSQTGKQEYFVSEIFLPVDDPKEEANVKQLANKLSRELSQKRAPFERLAAQFSQSAGASKGGMLGWVQEGQLPEELDKALSRMNKGSTSNPVRSLSGYHILLLRDKREIAADNLPSRDDIMNRLGTAEMERQQRRYFLDLKSAAFIEKRV